MNFFLPNLVILTSLTLVFTNFIISLPADASVVCESGTISSYQNGSLSNCILGQDTTVQVSGSNIGTSNFSCQAKKLISFDDKAQFQSCYLSEGVQLRKGNLIEFCPAEYKISVLVSNDGIQFISSHLHQ